MVHGEVPEDWRNVCVVPLYKGKGDKDECLTHTGINLLSTTGKLYERVMIQRVKTCIMQQTQRSMDLNRQHKAEEALWNIMK